MATRLLYEFEPVDENDDSSLSRSVSRTFVNDKDDSALVLDAEINSSRVFASRSRLHQSRRGHVITSLLAISSADGIVDSCSAFVGFYKNTLIILTCCSYLFGEVSEIH